MTVIPCLMLLIAFLMLYSTSMKIKAPKRTIQNWFKKNHGLGKFLGACLMVLAFFLLADLHGTGAGILVGSIELMAVGSMTILFHPLIINSKRG